MRVRLVLNISAYSREEHVQIALQERLRSELNYQSGQLWISRLPSSTLTNAECVLVRRHGAVVNGVQRAKTVQCDELVAVLEVRRDRDRLPIGLRAKPGVRRRVLERPLLELVRLGQSVQEVHRRLDEVDVLADVLRHRVRVTAYTDGSESCLTT